MSLREVRPGGSHLGRGLISEVEMALLLVVFHHQSIEHLSPFLAGVSEPRATRCLEHRRLVAQVVVRSNLVQSVLLAKCLLLEEVICSLDVPKAHPLLRFVGGPPSLRMVPVGTAHIGLDC